MSVSFEHDRVLEGLWTGGVVGLGQVEEFLRRAVGRMQPTEEDTPRGVGRPRVLPSMCLWAGMLVCVLRGMGSQLELWRLLASKGLWEYPRFEVTDQAVYNRLASEGTRPLEELFGQVSALLKERLKPYELGGLASFAQEVVALDQSTLEKVARLVPTPRDANPKELVAGKIAGLFDVRAQQWRRVMHIQEANENEKVSAKEMLSGLAPGAMVLFDLGYFSFEWFDHLTDSGYHYLSRMRAKTSYEVIHVYHQDKEAGTLDCVVWLGKHRADRAAHAVRMVRFRVGQKTHSYITNVLDPSLLALHKIPRLYARRWDFELAMKLVKRELGLHLLWGCKPVVVQQQVWAVLIIAQVLGALRMEVAARAGVEVEEVSMGLLVRYMPRFAGRGLDPLKEFVEQGRALGFIRPSRRIDRRAPEIAPERLRALPESVALVRKPRYSGRRCDPRPTPKD
jgi:hypothetical protein